MSKSEQIMELYDGMRTPQEIAVVVGCLPEYVRVVARQRKGRGGSENDRRYRQSSLGRETIRKSQEKFRKAQAAYGKAWSKTHRTTGDRLLAREAGREAYRKAYGGAAE